MTATHPTGCQCDACLTGPGAEPDPELEQLEQWLQPGDLEALEAIDPSAPDAEPDDAHDAQPVSASDDELLAAASGVLEQARQMQGRTVALLRELADNAHGAAASSDPSAQRHALAHLSTELRRLAGALET